MEIQDVMSLINSTGFPIACCIALFWLMNKFLEALNNNTKAIIELKEYLTKKEV